MAVYSVLFARGYANPATSTLIYTAPADGTTVLRDLVLVQSSGSAGFIALTLTPPGGATLFLCTVKDAVSDQTYHFDLRQVLPPGTLVKVVGTAAPLTYHVSGYRLGVAP